MGQCCQPQGEQHLDSGDGEQQHGDGGSREQQGDEIYGAYLPEFEEEEMEAEMVISLLRAESDMRRERMKELAANKLAI